MGHFLTLSFKGTFGRRDGNGLEGQWEDRELLKWAGKRVMLTVNDGLSTVSWIWAGMKRETLGGITQVLWFNAKVMPKKEDTGYYRKKIKLQKYLTCQLLVH